METESVAYTWEDWLADYPEAKERTRRIVAAFKSAPREKPRDPVSARILREMGTPEERIGPVLDEQPDEEGRSR